MLIQSDEIVTGESSLDFFIVNDGEIEEAFYYEFYDHSGLFNSSSGSMSIQQGEKIQLSFPQVVFDEEISYAFELTITPIHNLEKKKIICYPSCTVNIFPGDTDNNGIVDEFDILPIGIYFNEKGNSRTSTGFSWNEYKVAKWDSVPVTYADANGDGTVDGRDVVGIGVNWENTHDISGKSYKITEGYIFTEIEKENLLQFYNSIFGTDVPSVKIRKLLEKILDINQPEKFLLLQNHPNPFNSNTTIGFNLPTPNTVSIRIFDILGREISVILDGKYYRAGAHSVQINSDLFSSGVYFYQVQSGEFINQKKMVILK